MELLKRKPNRLRTYDYSSNGVYFVTICTEGRRKTLCEIVGDGLPVPKEPGVIAEAYIKRIPIKYPCVNIDHYVVMPNHIHMLLLINGYSGTGNPSPTLGNVVGWYKYQVTKEINERKKSKTRFFQRSYHDHVVRGERDYLKIWNYIEGNPMKWTEDCFYTQSTDEVESNG